MTDELEAKFTKIAYQAVEAAEHVECSFQDFIDGLDLIMVELGDRLETAINEAVG